MAIGQGRWGVRANAPAIISGNDTDAQAFIAAAGITDTTQQSAINTLVLNFKSYGIWTKMKAIYPMVGGTANAHKLNLKDPRDIDAAFRLGFYGGWIHSSTGAKPNGSTGYADTFVKPSTDLTLNGAGISYYARTLKEAVGAYAGNGVTMGGGLGVAELSIFADYASGVDYLANNSSEFSGGVLLKQQTGLIHNTRIISSSFKVYRNGSTVYTLPLGSGNRTALSLYIGAVNGYNDRSNVECSFSAIDTGLTDAEAANYYTAVQTFQTTLGRQVGVPIVADTDAQAFLNAAVITNTTQASAINTLVTNLKSYGIWSKMKAIYPFVGGTATTHKFNLKNPADSNAAFRLQFNGGGTHDSNGYNMNGTNAYGDTYFNPSLISGFNNNNHYSIYLKTETPVGGGWHIGVGNTNTGDPLFGFAARRNMGGGVYQEIFDSGNNSQNGRLANSVADGRGFFIGSKTSANSRVIYRNSTQILSSSLTVTSVTPPNDVMYIGAMKGSSGSSNLYLGGINSFTTIGDGLTDTEAANLYIAVQAFQTTLGRQV